MLEVELLSVEGDQGLPCGVHSQLQAHHRTQQSPSTGGTSVKTGLRTENTEGKGIRGGNDGAEKGGMKRRIMINNKGNATVRGEGGVPWQGRHITKGTEVC